MIFLNQMRMQLAVCSQDQSNEPSAASAGLNLDEVLAPLNALARRSPLFTYRPLRMSGPEGRACELASYILTGPGRGGDTVRIGLFGGIHGDEPVGPLALSRFAFELETQPEPAAGYELFFYPACNPVGLMQGTREGHGGKDLNRQFWRDSDEPEVRLLEQEIRARKFQGMISLHADDTSDGIYGYVRGAVLTRGLLEPALRAAERILPRNTRASIDGFPAHQGIISQCFEGILTSPPELSPLPFEIIFETPALTPIEVQTEAALAALRSILFEYQELLAFAANL